MDRDGSVVMDPRPVVPPCQIDLDFGDGTYLFKLNGPQRAELQRLCGVKANHPQYGEVVIPTGLGTILTRVMKGRYLNGGKTFGHPEQGEWHDADLTETIRLGLIGGGMDAVNARRMIETYVETAPRARAWDLAAAILWACVQGFVPPAAKGADPPKKAKAGKTMASSTTPPS